MISAETIRQLSPRRKRRLLLIGSLGVVALLFLALLNSQKRETDPTYLRSQMIASEQIRELKTWRVRFENCSSNCTSVGDSEYYVSFPALEETRKLVESIYPRPTNAHLFYQLSDEERMWVKSRSGSVVLILPQLVQDRTIDKTTVKRPVSVGLAATAQFPFRIKDLQGPDTTLYVEIAFPNYPNFGPADAPIVLADTRAAPTYGNLSTYAIASSFMGRQLEIGIPLLLAGIALILDHSRVFSALSFYAVFRAFRHYISFDWNLVNRTVPLTIPVDILGSTISIPIARPLLTAINTVTVLLLIHFICLISHVNLRRKTIGIGTVVIVMIFVAGYFAVPNFAVKSDLWSDLIACAAALPVTILGAKFHLSRREEFDDPIDREIQKTTALSTTAYWSRFTLISLALIATAWINLSDLISFGNHEFKETLNWAHAALLPTLIVASLLEIGSTTKKMRAFSQLMVSKAMIDKDLQVGKEIQERLLPIRRGDVAMWSWRTFYYPAVSLAGDWFDIHKVTFADGKEFLVACLADVTGHGIGAALITTTISSHWSMWIESLAKIPSPTSDGDRESLLVQGPERIHRGLIALKRNSGCTAGFLLVDCAEGKLTYCIAGHPGILTYDPASAKMGFYATQGTRPGFEGSDPRWEAKTTAIAPGESIHLFSDGIVTPGEPVSKWFKAVQREQKSRVRPLSLTLLASIRKNRSQFRKDRANEDDMSLIILSRRS